jgi:hypothetical protein
MRYVFIIGRIVSLVARLGAVYVRSGFGKRSAVRRFERELLQQGLPRHVASQLTLEYADMVSLNPIDYTKTVKHK